MAQKNPNLSKHSFKSYQNLIEILKLFELCFNLSPKLTRFKIYKIKQRFKQIVKI
jgi:hypothetical protein